MIGGLISRFHGGGFVGGFNKSIKNIIWALPFGVIAYYCTQSWLLCLLCFTLCLAGKATGHGGGMDLGFNSKEPNNGRKPEKLEYIILWAHPYLPRYVYDALLLAIVGFAAVSGLSLALLINGDAVNAAIIAVSGAAKALAYMIGWVIYPESEGEGHKDFNEATEIGEFLTGVFAYMGLGWLVVTSMIYTL